MHRLPHPERPRHHFVSGACLARTSSPKNRRRGRPETSTAGRELSDSNLYCIAKLAMPTFQAPVPQGEQEAARRGGRERPGRVRVHTVPLELPEAHGAAVRARRRCVSLSRVGFRPAQTKVTSGPRKNHHLADLSNSIRFTFVRKKKQDPELGIFDLLRARHEGQE